MSRSPVRWYIKAQLGVLLLPVGLCLFGEAVSRKVVQMLGKDAGPWFWYGTLSLICINAGIGLMIDSGLTRGFPGTTSELIRAPRFRTKQPVRKQQPAIRGSGLGFPMHESATVLARSRFPTPDQDHPMRASATRRDRYDGCQDHP